MKYRDASSCHLNCVRYFDNGTSVFFAHLECCPPTTASRSHENVGLASQPLAGLHQPEKLLQPRRPHVFVLPGHRFSKPADCPRPRQSNPPGLEHFFARPRRAWRSLPELCTSPSCAWLPSTVGPVSDACPNQLLSSLWCSFDAPSSPSATLSVVPHTDNPLH